jgi:hypothetical protein
VDAIGKTAVAAGTGQVPGTRGGRAHAILVTIVSTES